MTREDQRKFANELRGVVYDLKRLAYALDVDSKLPEMSSYTIAAQGGAVYDLMVKDKIIKPNEGDNSAEG